MVLHVKDQTTGTILGLYGQKRWKLQGLLGCYIERTLAVRRLQDSGDFPYPTSWYVVALRLLHDYSFNRLVTASFA